MKNARIAVLFVFVLISAAVLVVRYKKLHNIAVLFSAMSKEQALKETPSEIFPPSIKGQDRLSKPDTDITQTIDILKQKLDEKLSLPAVNIREVPEYCNRSDARGNSCSGQCQRLAIDPDVQTRITQLVTPPHLQMTPYYHQVLEQMAQNVKGHYDVILATGASDNHYLESQALIQNLHEKVFPTLTNFTFVYYNLGLNAKNRAQLAKHCRCQVVDFPFSKFPKFFKKLSCYTWKPMIIKAHIKQSNVLVWVDSSVRFNQAPQSFKELVDEARKWGLQFNAGLYSDCASRTMPTTFHFFGEEPCAYIGRGEIWATFGFYSRNYLVERLLLEPWVACAVDQKCMCPVPFPQLNAASSIQMMDRWKKGKGTIKYGMAHRFDQSALNILVMKIYRERYVDVLMRNEKSISIRRGQKVKYFPQN